MTKEQQRIAFAEALGWRKMVAPKELGFGASAGDKCWYFTHQLPNIDDLNVIHKAEEALKTDRLKWQIYTNTLHQMFGNGWYDDSHHATAAQRREAFLKTVGKWEEPPTKPQCPTCQGDGRSQNKMHQCVACHGEGKLWCAMCGSWGNHSSGQCPELAHRPTFQMNTNITVHQPPQPTPSERVKIWRERSANARIDQAKCLNNQKIKPLSKWFEGIADGTDRCANELEYHVLRQIDCGRIQYLERVTETADALEKWLGENTGTNDDWPIEIKADQDGASKLSRLLSDLSDALKPLRMLKQTRANK